MVSLLIPASCLYAEDATPIVVNGDVVQYDYANKKVIGRGNVSVTYKDIKMTCEVIVVDVEKKKGVAGGNVILYQEGSVFKADEVHYNFEEKTGRLIKGGMRMLPWYGRADTIDKVDDKIFKLNKSYVSTCDYDKPHYRIEAKTIKVYLDDRVTAWNVFMHVGDAPVMYIPYYNHPLKDNMPQVALVPGRNDEWGSYLLSAWRYYFHPDSKGNVHVDWRSRRGYAGGIDYKYRLREFGSGYARFYYLHDKEPDESQELGTSLPSDRWRVQLRHKWDVDKNTVMAAEYHKLSDQSVVKDYFNKEEYERENKPSSYLMLTGAKGNYALTYLYEPKVNDFFDVVERLPEAKLYIRTLQLFKHLNLYYSNESAYARLNKNNAKDTGRHERPGDNYDAARIDTYNQLSYPIQLLGFLNVNPFAATRETFYSESASGHEGAKRYIFETGADFYTRFYKMYDIETDFLELDIHKVRHLIIPSVQYVYRRRPNLIPEELLQFDGIDNLDSSHIANLSLQHKLQTKRTTLAGGKRADDLLRFEVTADYIFEDHIGNFNELADTIEYNLEIYPYDWMSLHVDADFLRRDRMFNNVNTYLSIVQSDDFILRLGHNYLKHEKTQVTGQLIYDLWEEDWKKHLTLEVYERYEIQEKVFEEQQYSIVKDLHCWTGELTCRVKDQSDFTFWVIFRLKAFPEMPFYFRTTYHGPEPGTRRDVHDSL